MVGRQVRVRLIKTVHDRVLRKVHVVDADILRAVDIDEVCNEEVMVVAKEEVRDIEEAGIQVTHGLSLFGVRHNGMHSQC